MEKAIDKKLIRIVITGPESTGKTLLCELLARHYHTIFIPEYAREYIMSLNRKYKYDDVIHIANKQIELELDYSQTARNILFYDTYLIITKVWLDIVYNKYPAWIDSTIKNHKIDLFLICAPDIPWVPEQVRENGGEMREKLFKRYIDELENYKYAYKIISGEQRFEKAKEIIDELLKIN